MLRRVLESFEQIKPDQRSEIRFIIVENGPKAGASEIASSFGSRLKITYIHEPKLGIANARNTGIEAFLKTDAEWMATIDDDENVSENWLIAMLNAIHSYPQCKVFAGPHIRVLPEGINQWLKAKPKPNPETGTLVWNVSTANALFHRSVFASDQMGMRFHQLFNLSGGSDTHLFFQLNDLGEDVLWVREAECFEPMVLERTYFRIRVRRSIQSAQNWGSSVMLRRGNFRGGFTILSDCLICAINFITFGVVGAFVNIFHAGSGRAILNKSLSLGCYAVGYFKAVFRPQGEIYRKIDGE